jgi:hypothetical protein
VFLDGLLGLRLWTCGLPFGDASMGCNCELVGLDSHQPVTTAQDAKAISGSMMPKMPLGRRTSSLSYPCPQGHKIQVDAHPATVPLPHPQDVAPTFQTATRAPLLAPARSNDICHLPGSSIVAQAQLLCVRLHEATVDIIPESKR